MKYAGRRAMAASTTSTRSSGPARAAALRNIGGRLNRHLRHPQHRAAVGDEREVLERTVCGAVWHGQGRAARHLPRHAPAAKPRAHGSAVWAERTVPHRSFIKGDVRIRVLLVDDQRVVPRRRRKHLIIIQPRRLLGAFFLLRRPA